MSSTSDNTSEGSSADSVREAPAPDDPFPRRTSSESCDVDIVDAARRLNPEQARWLSAHVKLALDHLGASGDLRIRLVADAEMADAHQRHMDVARTTDVITFDLAPDDERAIDTDLLVCVDEARRQSERRSISLEREVLLYVIHGALHCLGFDDAEPDDARAMHAKEDQILEAIGVGATYAGSAAPEAPAS